MTCSHEPLAGDYVDGTLEPSPASTFEAHLAGCPSCTALVGDLRAIRGAAAQLEQRPVPARVWAQIEARVRSKHTAVPSSRFGHLLPRFRARWVPLAAAACLLLMATGVWMLQWAGNRTATKAPDPMATAPAPEPVDADLQVAQGHYESAIADLQQIARAEGETLDPQTSAVLDSNLSVIDMAIDESRAALDEQPTSDAARESLFEALRTKVVLLQDTVTLINDMRTSDQDGVTRVISGSNQ